MQRYFAEEKHGNYIKLFNSDMHHIKNVMRMNVSDKIECIYDEKLYICSIIDPNVNKFEIVDELDDNNELNCEITIAVGLVKEQKMDLILQKLTELGVSKIIPLKMERSIVKLDDKRLRKRKERWISICKEAAEQSKRNKIPIIEDVKDIKNFCCSNYDIKCVCSVSNQENLVNKYLQKNNNCAKMIFVIGPEGGITSREESFLNDIGFTSVSLGNRVLRVETAAIYVASVLNFSSMG